MVGKILIVDGVATNRIVFKVALAEAFYQPVLAADGESCLHLARDLSPDLILLDLALPDQSGVSLVRQLRADPATRDIPILALAATNDEDLRFAALQAGADDVLAKAIDHASLLARVRNLLRGRDGVEGLAPNRAGTDLFAFADAPAAFVGRAIVSLLADQMATAVDWHDTLSQEMTDTILIQSREEAFLDANRSIGQSVPDVFLITTGPSGNSDGLRLMSELRSRAATRHSAVCILRPKGNSDSNAIAYDLGADDVVNADVPPRELAQRLQTLIRRKRREDQLRATVQDGLRLAMIDPLTALHNRRYAMPKLAAISAEARAESTTFAVMVIDIDRFKSVNDRFGHAAGDAILVEVANRLKANLRADDLLARIGGEEFLVALADTSFDEARLAADRLCKAIEERPVKVAFSSGVAVTVSIGVAVSCAGSNMEPTPDIVDRADQALLLAKADGRNQVIISKSAA